MGTTEEYGAHSRCFMWRKKGDFNGQKYAECNLAKCNNGRVKIKLKSGNYHTCMYDGQEVNTGTDYVILCPNAADFCTDWAYRCPMDCNGNGICMNNNKCFCFLGFGGADCVSF